MLIKIIFLSFIPSSFMIKSIVPSFSTICQVYQRFLGKIMIRGYLIQPVEESFLGFNREKVHNKTTP